MILFYVFSFAAAAASLLIPEIRIVIADVIINYGFQLICGLSVAFNIWLLTKIFSNNTVLNFVKNNKYELITDTYNTDDNYLYLYTYNDKGIKILEKSINFNTNRELPKTYIINNIKTLDVDFEGKKTKFNVSYEGKKIAIALDTSNPDFKNNAYVIYGFKTGKK